MLHLSKASLLFFLLILCFGCPKVVAQLPESAKNAAEKHWVDSIFQQLTVKQKIAQQIVLLFTVHAYQLMK